LFIQKLRAGFVSLTVMFKKMKKKISDALSLLKRKESE
jgi:hypothetical protein